MSRAVPDALPTSATAAFRRRLRLTAVLYLAAWAVTALVGVPRVEAERLRRLMDVSESEQAYATKQIENRAQWRLQLLQERAGSDDPAVIEAWLAKHPDPLPVGSYPEFHAEVWSPAPFVLVVGAGRSLGPLVAHGYTTVELWFFGATQIVLVPDFWVS